MNEKNFREKILAPLEEWAHLGEIKNEMMTRLIGHTPHIAPKAYVNVVYAALSNKDFLELSKRLKRPIPVQYKQFLKYANGMNIFSDAFRVLGYTPLERKASVHVYNYPSNIIVSNVSARMKGLAEDDVVVGFYKEDGSYAYIEKNGRVVRFDAKGNGEMIREWIDFDTWLSTEIAVLKEAYKAGKVSIFVPSTTK